ncbi:BnaA06g28490D [Brassica napus]|uniref:BnaA06g28490D protein n=1 Tax=Brassica napus TaxID=3708 RepID=A0A078J9B8_BRANA|nr:BnaA06g28490D [Brassica napus]
MATTTRMFCFVLVMVLMGCCCSAKIYKVGDSKGWTTAKHGSYYEWAKLKKFQVGDSLMFEYDGNINVPAVWNTNSATPFLLKLSTTQGTMS